MSSIQVTLIEDNAIFCFLFKKFLEDYPSKKVDIEIFSDGRQAWNHFDSIKDLPSLHPDIIFVDINMPFMNGWQLIENLVASGNRIIHNAPIYVVSSSKSSSDKGKLEEYKFIKDYIVKPIDREGIYAILDNHFLNNN